MREIWKPIPEDDEIREGDCVQHASGWVEGPYLAQTVRALLCFDPRRRAVRRTDGAGASVYRQRRNTRVWMDFPVDYGARR